MTFQDSSNLGQATLAFLTQHGLPPSPLTYEVCYTYLSGAHERVSEDLDSLLAGGAPLSEDKIAEIYEAYLSPRAIQLSVGEVGDALEATIGRLSPKLLSGLEGSNNFSGKLRSTIRELAQSATKDQVRAIAKDLHTANQSYLALTVALSDELDATRSQLQNMKRELGSLRKSAMTDHLTQVANRRHFDVALNNAVNRAANGDVPLSLVLIDVDNFKSLNDTWGHAAGDTILRKLGALLGDHTKGKDTPARLGGDEFAIILPSATVDGAVAVSEAIRRAFTSLDWVIENRAESIGSVTLSIGAAAWHPDDDEDTLMERADQALYEAKNAGRDRIATRP